MKYFFNIWRDGVNYTTEREFESDREAMLVALAYQTEETPEDFAERFSWIETDEDIIDCLQDQDYDEDPIVIRSITREDDANVFTWWVTEER